MRVIDFEVQRCTRRCAATDRPLSPGEAYVSVLKREEGKVFRLDFAHDAWQGPGEDAIAWWRARIPESESSSKKLAPNEVLLRLFDEWADQPERRDARYVLALLLIRRRVFRIAASGLGLGGTAEREEQPRDRLRVDCPARQESYDVLVTPPGPDRAAAIQAELNELLYSDTP